MPQFDSRYQRFKNPILEFTYTVSYEVNEVIAWEASVYIGDDLIGKPNGRIELAGLPPEFYKTAVTIAVTASIENGISLNR